MSLEEKYLINQARTAEERAKALEIECEALRSEIVRIKAHAVPLTESEAFKAYTTKTGKRLPNIGESRAQLMEIVRAIEWAHGIISRPANKPERP